MTPDEIVKFLDDFRQLHGQNPQPSKLISLKVPVPLLNTFPSNAISKDSNTKRILKP